jgi:hypothetical protein
VEREKANIVFGSVSAIKAAYSYCFSDTPICFMGRRRETIDTTAPSAIVTFLLRHNIINPEDLEK